MTSARGLRPLVAVVALALVCGPAVGHAQAPADEASGDPEAPRLVREPLDGERATEDVGSDTRRALPDYDGRPDPKPTPGERALWIPRVVLAPVYAVNEYVLRRPIGALAVWGEKNHLGARVANVFTFGTGGQVGIYPTAMLDFGLRPSVGLYLFARDVPTDGDHMGLHLAWGGDDWLRISFRERVLIGSDDGAQNTELSASRVGFHFVFDQRPDHLQRGSTLQANQPSYAFQRTRLGGAVDVEAVFGDLDGIEFALSAYRNRFNDGDGDLEKADASIFDAFVESDDPRADVEAVLPGFDGYVAATAELALILDSRDPNTANPGSGVRLRAETAVGTDVDDTDATWMRWGLDLGLHGDINGRRRVVALRQRVEFDEALGSEATPFTELPTLGGVDGLRGFVDGEVRARSTWLTTVQYSYPVWAFMDGYLFYEVGNGFGEHLDGFRLDALASSFGIGLRSNADRDVAFSLLVAAGVTPFDATEYGVESVRLVLGTQRGF